MGDRDYIDEKFKEILVTLKWIGTLLAIILIAFSGVIGTNTVRSVKNKAAMERYEQAFRQAVTKQQLSRVVEFSKIRKELVMAVVAGISDEDIDLLWDKLEELETMIVEDDYGYYFRGAYESKRNKD